MCACSRSSRLTRRTARDKAIRAVSPVAALFGLTLLAGCAAGGRTGPTGPVAEPALPGIPAVDGPLVIDVVYPPEDGDVTVRDSTFVFGSVGTGTATLRINGTPVQVAPNGAFLAFLPVPGDGVYRFEASTRGETATFERVVRIPPPPATPTPGRAEIVAGSDFPVGSWAAPAGETIEVGFRGTPGGTAWLHLPDGRRIPLAERLAPDSLDPRLAFTTEPGRDSPAPTPAVSLYHGLLPAMPLEAADAALPRPTLAASTPPPAAALDPDGAAPRNAAFVLVVGEDTARAPLRLNAAVLAPPAARAATLFDPNIDQTTDRMIVGRPGPGLTYSYFWPNGTEVAIDAERGQEYRVRLTPDLTAWVAADRVRLHAVNAPPPGGPIGTVRMDPHERGVDVRVELPRRLPFHVRQEGNALVLLVFGARSNTSYLQYGRVDPLIHRAQWDQPDDYTFRLVVELTRAPWGYLTFWDGNDLVFRIRRPPEIDPRAPLRGLLIAVDPGHPPAGATGPTRLDEAEANLAIALCLAPLLERAGARVLLTRATPDTVPLNVRPQMATDADADILLSIHNNAFPDGVNPFLNHGTSTYYFHPHSVDLARALQIELLREFRLPDIGYGRSNLALVRPTWMPSTLVEIMFLMIPQQEVALRDPDVHRRAAEALLRGLENFLRDRARADATRP